MRVSFSMPAPVLFCASTPETIDMTELKPGLLRRFRRGDLRTRTDYMIDSGIVCFVISLAALFMFPGNVVSRAGFVAEMGCLAASVGFGAFIGSRIGHRRSVARADSERQETL